MLSECKVTKLNLDLSLKWSPYAYLMTTFVSLFIFYLERLITIKLCTLSYFISLYKRYTISALIYDVVQMIITPATNTSTPFSESE